MLEEVYDYVEVQFAEALQNEEFMEPIPIDFEMDESSFEMTANYDDKYDYRLNGRKFIGLLSNTPTLSLNS